MLIVIGFDPGSHSCGWSRIDVRGSAPDPVVCTFLEGGSVNSAWFDVDHLLRALAADHNGTLVAIEWLEGIAYPCKHANVVSGLIASAAAAGIVEGTARAMGLNTSRVPAVKWRGLVCGRPNANDALVKAALEARVVGMPKRSSVHVRDAIGCAVGAAWAAGGDRVARESA